MTIEDSVHPPALGRGATGCRPDLAIDRLSHLVIAETTVDEVLDAVVTLALVAVPATACALTLVGSPGQQAPGTVQVVGSSGFAESLARADIELRQGPSTDASVAAWSVRAGHLPRETRWPRWARRAAAGGMRSALSTPLPGHDDARVTLTWLSVVDHRFDPVDEIAAHRFAAAAGPAVRSALVATELRASREGLQTALTSRATIDQAIGIFMARTGGSPEDAWQRLRSLSQREHVKVAELARRTVEQTTRQNRRDAAPERDAG